MSYPEINKNILGILKSNKAVYNLTKNRISIGRNKQSVIIINHPSVSKDHAIIEFDSDFIATLKDLNSSNGTYLNGEKLQSSPVKLRTNDKIIFGKDENEYIFENFQNENEKTEIYAPLIRDDKISLVNENEIQSTKINHFKNKGLYVNERNQFFNNNNYNNNNDFNDYNNNNFFNKNVNSFENNRPESPQFFNNTNKNDFYDNNNNLNNNINDISFKNKDDLVKQLQSISLEKEDFLKKNEELQKIIETKTEEVNKINDLFDQLSEEYSKLNSKHNTLIVYASDLQKKVDLMSIEI